MAAVCTKLRRSLDLFSTSFTFAQGRVRETEAATIACRPTARPELIDLDRPIPPPKRSRKLRSARKKLLAQAKHIRPRLPLKRFAQQ